MAQVNKRILIVDEEKDVGGTFETMLKNYGFDIDYFTDPVLALEKFKPNLYDLAILALRCLKLMALNYMTTLNHGIRTSRHYLSQH